MLTEFTVTNFRNLKDVSLQNLGRITLIAGKNGVGKTALLESLWLLNGPGQSRVRHETEHLQRTPDYRPRYDLS